MDLEALDEKLKKLKEASLVKLNRNWKAIYKKYQNVSTEGVDVVDLETQELIEDYGSLAEVQETIFTVEDLDEESYEPENSGLENVQDNSAVINILKRKLEEIVDLSDTESDQDWNTENDEVLKSIVQLRKEVETMICNQNAHLEDDHHDSLPPIVYHHQQLTHRDGDVYRFLQQLGCDSFA